MHATETSSFDFLQQLYSAENEAFLSLHDPERAWFSIIRVRAQIDK
jgi:hypothetical protein